MHCEACHSTFDGIELIATHQPDEHCVHPRARADGHQNGIWYRPDSVADREDAAFLLDMDPVNLGYRTAAELPGPSQKAIRNAGTIAVTNVADRPRR